MWYSQECSENSLLPIVNVKLRSKLCRTNLLKQCVTMDSKDLNQRHTAVTSLFLGLQILVANSADSSFITCFFPDMNYAAG